MDIKKEIEIAQEQLINFQKYQKFCAEQRFTKESDAIENLERVERLSYRIAHLSKRIYDLSYAQMRKDIDERLEKYDLDMKDRIPDEVAKEVVEEVFGLSQPKFLTMGDWDNPDNRTNNQIHGSSDG